MSLPGLKSSHDYCFYNEVVIVSRDMKNPVYSGPSCLSCLTCHLYLCVQTYTTTFSFWIRCPLPSQPLDLLFSLTRTLARVYCFLWLQLNWQLYRRPCGSYKWILCSVRSTLCFSCHGPYHLLSKLAHACALHLQTVSSVNLETPLSVPHKSSQNLAHSRHSVNICRIMGIYTYGCWSILEPPSC